MTPEGQNKDEATPNAFHFYFSSTLRLCTMSFGDRNICNGGPVTNLHAGPISHFVDLNSSSAFGGSPSLGLFSSKNLVSQIALKQHNHCYEFPNA